MVLRLLSYFLLGGALLVVSHTLTPAPQLTVPDSVRSSAPYQQNEWILLDQAYRLDWGASDPVSMQYMVRAMRDIGEQGTGPALLDKAIALNLHRHDPVVRARLLDRARRALRTVPNERLPSQETLRAYARENQQLFEREGDVRFAQVFYEDASGVHARAKQLQQALQDGSVEPGSMLAHGDPLLDLRPVLTAPPSRLEARFGKDYRATLEACPLESFCGPARSVYGLHYFFVLSRKQPGMPSFPEIEQNVRKLYLQHLEQEMENERMGQLRRRYGL